MKIGLGNEKLGKRIATISREVGPTCPSDCPFLNNGCYAERIQRRRPNVLAAWRANNKPSDNPDVKKLRKAKAIRLHVAGDFLLHGALDRKYLARLLWTLRTAKRPAWVYTHAWRELQHHVKYLRAVGVEVFASVHDEWSASKARSLGYRIAYMPGIAKKGYAGRKAGPVGGAPAIVCPEQIGTKKSCEECKYCFTDTKNGVVFLDH